VNQNQR